MPPVGYEAEPDDPNDVIANVKGLDMSMADPVYVDMPGIALFHIVREMPTPHVMR
jgi:hypothetical protein